ncbi:MAG: nucleotidyltransferase domain-containing protein [bacterium]
MIDLKQEYLEEVKRILRAHVPGCEVRVFGSRVQGQSWKYSDLDLVIVGESQLDDQNIYEFKDAFSESDLPIMVDVLDWHAIRPQFREMIAKQYQVIQEAQI